MDIIKSLNWRYATKKFDQRKKVSEKDFEMLMEAARLAPSSWGLQPWKFVVVKNKKLRQKLFESCEQDQVLDASHFVVLCGMTKVDERHITRHIESIAKAQGVTVESLKNYKKAIMNSMLSKNEVQLKKWISNQVFLSLGVLLSACAVNKIDACPMGGFDHKDFDKILGLKKRGLQSIVCCAIGYRSKKDEVRRLKKARFAQSEVVLEI